MTNLKRVSRVIPNIADNMNDWQYTFDPVSKEEWIQQIETDLRHKPISSLESTWWPGEPLTPLVHAEDSAGESVKLPGHFFNHPPLITESIHTRGASAESVNQKILEALQCGVQSIILHTTLSERLTEELWFSGVMKEMITLAVQPESITPDTLNSLSDIESENLLVRVIRNGSSIPIKLLVDHFQSAGKKPDMLRFVYPFASSGKWDMQTAEMINNLSADFILWIAAGLKPGAFLDQCILSTEADSFYFKHIVQSRVLHLLWQNIRVHYDCPAAEGNENYLECHIESRRQEHPDQFLIRASMSALAASLSGTHALCIHQHTDNAIQSHYRRINRNIHHLLNLESGMYKGKDPLSGSFAIDYHCRQWTKKIWDMLSLEN